jgi:hypothetical protein
MADLPASLIGPLTRPLHNPTGRMTWTWRGDWPEHIAVAVAGGVQWGLCAWCFGHCLCLWRRERGL